jgi:hypothetical protein
MSFLNSIGEKVSGFYHFFEDKWYDLLDKIDSKVPVYKIVDPIDKIIPSFIVFLLIVVFLIFAGMYFIQFSSPYELTITTFDSSTTKTLSRVMLTGMINDASFDGLSDSAGEFISNVSSPPKNIYALVSEMLFGSDDSFEGKVNASKQGYKALSRIPIADTREVQLLLEPLPTTEPPPSTTGSTTTVVLIDSETSRTLVNNSDEGRIKFLCRNKSISERVVKDGDDGVVDGKFVLNESNCEFILREAYFPDYQRKVTSQLLSSGQSIHRIPLEKNVSNPVTGTAKVWVFDADTQEALSGIRVTLSSVRGEYLANTNESGLATKSALLAGKYTITITDSNFYNITPADNITLTVVAGDVNEVSLDLTRIQLSDKRKIHFKVIDSYDKNALSGVNVDLLWVINDGNDLSGVTDNGTTNYVSGAPSHTDANGLFYFDSVTQLDEGKIVAILRKENYILEIFRPQIMLTSVNPELIELEEQRTDDEDNPVNYGRANVLVVAGDQNGALWNANTRLFFRLVDGTSTIESIPVLRNSLPTDRDGIAVYDALSAGPGSYYSANAEYSGAYSMSEELPLDLGNTIEFRLKLDFDISQIEVELYDAITQQRISSGLSSAEINVSISNNDTFDDLDFLERIAYSQGKFISGNIDPRNNLLVEIKVNHYVTSWLTIDSEITPLLPGLNKYSIELYIDPNNPPGGIVDPDVNDPINPLDPDDDTNGRVIIMFDNIYNITDPAWERNSTAVMMFDSNTYRAKFDVIINKNDVNYSELLSMVRVENALIKNIYYTPIDFNTGDTFSCSNATLDATSHGEEYYLPTGDCLGDDRILAGFKWADQNLDKGTYSFMIDFEVNQATSESKVAFNYRARAIADNNVVESRLKRIELPVGVPFGTDDGFIMEINLNGTQLVFSQTELLNDAEQSVSLIPLTENGMDLTIHNNSVDPIRNATLTIYSHAGTKESFTSTSAGSGLMTFSKDTITGVTKLALDTSVQIAQYSQKDYSLDVTPQRFRSGNYLVVVLQGNGQEYKAFIDASAQGKIFTLDAEFFARVPDQIFDGTISSVQGNPIIDSIYAKTYRNCLTTKDLDTTINIPNRSHDALQANYFAFEVPGEYTSHDCIELEIMASDTASSYESLKTLIYASSNDARDVGLGCVDITSENGNAIEETMEWNDNLEVNVANYCDAPVRVNIETGLVCSTNTSACKTTGGILLGKQESKNFVINGKNKSYNSSQPTPNFSDVLGFYPITVKAKFDGSRKRFSIADEFDIHLVNSRQCFAISKDNFNMAEAVNTAFSITDDCQYTGIDDYYVPRASLDAIGYSVDNPFTTTPTNVVFDLTLLLEGREYTRQTTTELIEDYWFRETLFAEDLPSTIGTDRTDYNNLLFDFNSNNLTQRLGNSWVINKVQVQVIDINNDRIGAPGVYGAALTAPLTVNYVDGTTRTVTPTTNFTIDDGLGCTTNACHIDAGLGEGHVGGDEFVFGVFYVDVPEGKVSSITTSVVGNKDINFLEISLRPQVKYTKTTEELVATVTDATPQRIPIGTYAIYPFSGVDFVISHVERMSAFSDPIYINKINPQAYIESSDPSVLAWVDRGYLSVRYLGEDTTEYNDRVIDLSLVKTSASGTLLGTVNIVDYVDEPTAIANPTPRQISGAR